MMKRKLSLEEIEFIADAIIPNPYISKDVAMCIVDNLKQNIRKQLSNIETYPQNIPKLKDEIHKYYIRSQLDPSESVGCIAASSIGADTTQASLNSVEWNTRVLIDKNGTMKEDCIGRIIDDEFKTKGFTTVVYSGQIDDNIKNGNNPYAQVLNTDDKNWLITSIDEDGKSSWKKITQLIRHPLYTGLIKVTTKTGRSVVATTGLSFLVMRENKIVFINGSELTIGDKLPICWSIPKPNNIKTTLHLKDYLSPREYIYGSDLWKAKEIRDHYYVSLGKKKYPWWKEHNGIDFILPFQRGDTAMECIEGKGKSKIGNEDILKGYVYNHIRSSAQNLIPEYIPLDEDFGFFIGAYLADGCSSDNYIAISKYDKSYLYRIEKLATKWGVKTHYTNIGYKYRHMNRYEEKKGREVTEYAKNMENNEGNADIRLHSTLLNTLISNLCGKGSENKRVPDFAYNAPDEFVRGMLDGLFSGDGCITKEDKTYCSVSNTLIDGILTFLARIKVFATKGEVIVDKNNKGSKIILPMYTLRIGSKNVTRFTEFIGNLTIKEKDNKLKEQLSKNRVRTLYHLEKDNVLNDVIMDEIVSIKNVETNTYVYDFTVEKTKIFIVGGNQPMADSFHSAGIGKANLTGGLVRQNELLNASKKVKTPSCSIYLNKDMIDVKDLFKVKEFSNSNIRYYELQDMIDNVTIENNPTLTEEEKKYYNFFSNVFDEDYKGCEWRIRIDLKLDTLYKTKKTLLDITCAIYSCIDEEREYIGIVFYPDITGRLDIWVKDNIEEPETYIKTSKKKKLEVLESHKEVIDTIVNSDNKYQKFIKNILVPTIKLVPVSGIFGIEDCYYTQIKKTDEWMIDTKGSNYKELIIQPYIDFKKTKSNNMWDMLETLGVEGSHSFLVEEFSKVITVNKRHLNILLDSMTFPGKIMSVSRYGIDRKNVGPLAKACFEQPCENFLISATKGEIDDIVGVTAAITLGKLSRIGTGSIDLIIDEDKIKRELESMKLDKIEEEEELFLV
jgi:DNA-directed RNA polymerase subunit A"